jgi:hypothetical protein
MDRLTTVNGNNNIELVINESRVRIKDTDTLAVAKKLKEYEDMEEQDRLLKLPCKVGEIVYYINPNKNTINELVVYSFDIRPLQHFACDYMGARLNFNQFGKTVFLTKEEAKAAMDKLKGKYNKDIERD